MTRSRRAFSRPAPRRRGWRAPLASAALAFLLLAPAAQAALPGTSFSGSYRNAAGTRAFEGYVPSTYRAGTPLPLVVGLHGCTQTAADFRAATRFDDLAERRGFITVYPQQSPTANLSRCWNWFSAQNQARGQGEPSLVGGITDEVARRYSVDPRRTYVTGISAGGAMAVVMGATYPDRYAAIGVHAGCEFRGFPCGAAGGPDPVAQGGLAYGAMGAFARSVPVVVFQGDRDATVPPVNAEQVVQQWIATDDHADDGAYNGSISTARASTAPGQVPGGRAYDVDAYADGAGGELVQRWLVHGMGHAWSGGCSCRPFTDPLGPDATTATWEFFARHPRL